MKNLFFLSILLILFISLSVGAVTDNIEITADVFEFDGEKELIIASGNVTVLQEEVRIYSPFARFDREKKKIWLGGGVKLVRKGFVMTCQEILAYGRDFLIEAKGKVSLNYKLIKGRSDQLKFNVKKNELYLEGNPVVKKGMDVLKGDRILIDLDYGKIKSIGQAKVIFSVDQFQDPSLEDNIEKSQQAQPTTRNQELE